MPGQTLAGAAASFLGMWVVIMVAMMLPSLVPMLWRYRQAVGRTGETRLGRLTSDEASELADLASQLPWPPNVWQDVSVESARYTDRVLVAGGR